MRGFLELDCCDGFCGGPMSVGSALTLAYHLPTPSEASVGSQYKIVKGHNEGTGWRFNIWAHKPT